MSIWTAFVYILIPIGFITLLLLSIDLPAHISTNISNQLLWIGSCKIPYTYISIVNFLLATSSILFCIASFNLYKYQTEKIDTYSSIGINKIGLRWRAERNFWITITNLILYWSIFVIYQLKLKISCLINEISSNQEKSFKELLKNEVLVN